MSESDADRLIARKRQQERRALKLVAGVAVLGVALAAGFVFTHGVGVRIAPEDAAAAASVSIVDGSGFALGHKLYSIGAGDRRVRVSAPGFLPAEVDVRAASAERYVTVTLRERPATLVVESTPASGDSRWFVDGVLHSQGERLTIELSSGLHTVELDNPFFEPVSEQVSLRRGEAHSLTLAPAQIQGTLRVASTPAGASVTVNGEAVGATALALPLTGGVYAVEVTLPGFADVNDEVRLTRDRSTVERSYVLQSNPGFLTFDLSPPDGELLIDGRTVSRGRTRVSVGANVEHVVLFRSPGYTTAKRSVVVRPGQTEHLELALNDDIGSVSVESEPSATVLVNGVAAGTTPLTLNLPAEAQRIELRREGYVTETRSVTPSENSPQLVSVVLETEKAARMSASPARYTNAAGMTMVRFRPGSFEMGAPRSEKGQRANETPRTVSLTKPFYVSQTEVTAQQFALQPGSGGQGRLPKVNVSWSEAAAYCNRLSDREGLTRVYSFSGKRYAGADTRADGYRLLSEAEWEWLARRAGRRAQTRFTWGDEYTVPEGAGNLADESAKGKVEFYIARYTDGFDGLAPVGSFGPDAAGLSDLSGNVAEWVHDHYTVRLSPDATTTDPFGPARGEGHVIKGSSWRSGSVSELRAAYRDSGVAGRDDLGFRVARYVYGAEDAN
ncbi:MAG: PEGA domain-containing protein [Pseudomonadota bacterium]